MKVRDYLLNLCAVAKSAGNDDVCHTLVIACALVDPDKELYYSQLTWVAEMAYDGADSYDHYVIATKIARLIDEPRSGNSNEVLPKNR
jgi:hypothetical protein